VIELAFHALGRLFQACIVKEPFQGHIVMAPFQAHIVKAPFQAHIVKAQFQASFLLQNLRPVTTIIDSTFPLIQDQNFEPMAK
jgi:hypothetical protein